VTDRRSRDVVAHGKLSGRGIAAGIPAFMMRTQVATLPDIGDIPLGKAAVSPIANASGIEALGDEVVVAELEQLIDSRDDVRKGSVCVALPWSASASGFGKRHHAVAHGQ
jgi:hypothetical protein